ncbi:MAG: DUF3311 domain-containing protein [Deltaproteobacteria bacterium]|jgi:hypothetical protein|nr:DUF3311 domain-containing protein [Deltaproteobacteria bacterium]
MKTRLPSFIVGTIVPIAAVLGLMPWYNRAEPLVLGFPFGYFWIFLWIALTSVCLFIAYVIDPANKPAPLGGKEDEDGPHGV